MSGPELAFVSCAITLLFQIVALLSDHTFVEEYVFGNNLLM